MAEMGIKISSPGLDRILAKFPARVNTAIQLSLQQSALVIQNKAKMEAPYLTGNLRRSITHIVKMGLAKIGTNVEYARIREYATRGKPRGYLRPALLDNKRKIVQIFERNLSKLLWK